MTLARSVKALSAALLVSCALTSESKACGYYGCDFLDYSLQFGQAFGQLSPGQQAVFPLYDGSWAVQLRNNIFDNLFGINAFPGGFGGLLNWFDTSLQSVALQANPANYFPPQFCGMTAMGPAIPGFTVVNSQTGC